MNCADPSYSKAESFYNVNYGSSIVIFFSHRVIWFFAVMHITVSSCINVMSCPSNRPKKDLWNTKKYILNCSKWFLTWSKIALWYQIFVFSMPKKYWSSPKCGLLEGLLECTKLEIEIICKIFAKIVPTCLLSKQQQQSQLHCS